MSPFCSHLRHNHTVLCPRWRAGTPNLLVSGPPSQPSVQNIYLLAHSETPWWRCRAQDRGTQLSQRPLLGILRSTAQGDQYFLLNTRDPREPYKRGQDNCKQAPSFVQGCLQSDEPGGTILCHPLTIEVAASGTTEHYEQHPLCLVRPAWAKPQDSPDYQSGGRRPLKGSEG